MKINFIEYSFLADIIFFKYWLLLNYPEFNKLRIDNLNFNIIVLNYLKFYTL